MDMLGGECWEAGRRSSSWLSPWGGPWKSVFFGDGAVHAACRVVLWQGDCCVHSGVQSPAAPAAATYFLAALGLPVDCVGFMVPCRALALYEKGSNNGGRFLAGNLDNKVRPPTV